MLIEVIPNVLELQITDNGLCTSRVFDRYVTHSIISWSYRLYVESIKLTRIFAESGYYHSSLSGYPVFRCKCGYRYKTTESDARQICPLCGTKISMCDNIPLSKATKYILTIGPTEIYIRHYIDESDDTISFVVGNSRHMDIGTFSLVDGEVISSIKPIDNEKQNRGTILFKYDKSGTPIQIKSIKED